MSLLTAIWAAMKLVPKWVWLALAAALLWHVALAWHHNKVEAFGTERFNAGKAARDAEMTALQAKLDAANKKIAADIRKHADEENRRIAADADGLRLRGPGKSACPAVIPAAPGGHGKTDPGADAARPEMPSGQRAAVPWGWLVNRAEEHDSLLVEVKAWREWHARYSAEWDKWNAEAAPK